MAKKLIQTNFTYLFDGKRETGSYLGRKPASKKTVRRFLTENAKDSRVDPKRMGGIEVGSSFESRWISR